MESMSWPFVVEFVKKFKFSMKCCLRGLVYIIHHQIIL